MPIPTLYDKVVAGFNQATDRLKATTENMRIVRIAPTIHADHNTIAEVEIDLYPELEPLQPLPVGATQRYATRQLTYTRAHITTALQSLLGVPNGAYFFDSPLLATVNKASLVNYFNEIGLGLTEAEFELRTAGTQFGLVTDKSINFYGSVWFTTTGKAEPTPPPKDVVSFETAKFVGDKTTIVGYSGEWADLAIETAPNNTVDLGTVEWSIPELATGLTGIGLEIVPEDLRRVSVRVTETTAEEKTFTVVASFTRTVNGVAVPVTLERTYNVSAYEVQWSGWVKGPDDVNLKMDIGQTATFAFQTEPANAYQGTVAWSFANPDLESFFDKEEIDNKLVLTVKQVSSDFNYLQVVAMYTGDDGQVRTDSASVNMVAGGSTPVTVYPTNVSITIDEGYTAVAVEGLTRTLRLTVTPEDATIDDTTFEWLLTGEGADYAIIEKTADPLVATLTLVTVPTADMMLNFEVVYYGGPGFFPRSRGILNLTTA